MSTPQSSIEGTSDYLGKLGLERAPFLDQPDDHFFYADPILMQRLDLLQHLTQFGDMLLGVTGPTGSGKTTLLQQFVLRGNNNWRLCRIDAAQTQDPKEIYAHLAESLGSESHGDLTRTRNGVLRQCQVLQHNAQLAVLLIDNALQLPTETLNDLLNLAGPPKETLKVLRVILFALPTLEQHLIDAGLHSLQQPLLHKLEVPLFDEQQTAAYLMYRLAVAGYSGDSPFSLTEIRAMHKASGGMPGKLNLLAHETLVDRAGRFGARPARTEPAAPTHPSRRRAAWIGAAVVVVAGLATLFIQSGYLDSARDALRSEEQRSLDLPRETLTKVAPEEVPTPPKQESQEILVSTPEISQPTEKQGNISDAGEVQAPEPPVAPLSIETLEGQPAESSSSESIRPVAPTSPGTEEPPAAEAPTSPEPVQTTPPSPAPVLAEAPPTPQPSPETAAPVPTPVTPPEVSATADQPTATDQPVTTAQVNEQTSGPFREPWLLERPRDRFTLQILGVRDEASLLRYLRRNPLPEPVAYFKTIFKGSEWWVLLQGDYASSAAARRGAENLPPEIRKGKPWPRSFATIQDDIGKATR